ncbi:hypothetical protein WJX72_010805 [[Myrmecia] bisecta]|uniref:Berberine/berberine-like domain-containing protein n=1 Tax=[Myrmecia] bisecta TaxID=41462 RepID=A0AAW1RA93_9CHLO
MLRTSQTIFGFPDAQEVSAWWSDWQARAPSPIESFLSFVGGFGSVRDLGPANQSSLLLVNYVFGEANDTAVTAALKEVQDFAKASGGNHSEALVPYLGVVTSLDKTAIHDGDAYYAAELWAKNITQDLVDILVHAWETRPASDLTVFYTRHAAPVVVVPVIAVWTPCYAWETRPAQDLGLFYSWPYTPGTNINGTTAAAGWRGYYLVAFDSAWPRTAGGATADNDAGNLKYTLDVLDQLRPYVQGRSPAHNMYDDPATVPFGFETPEIFARVQRLKAAYDPKGLLRPLDWQSVAGLREALADGVSAKLPVI